MTDGPRPRVSRAAYLLGFAGLLPQVAAVLLLASSAGHAKADALAFGFGLSIASVYAAAILSFLGGMWWGFAIKRGSQQGSLAAVAVLPSLAAVALVLAGAIGLPSRWILVALGVVIILTLPVDRRLAATGDAPDGWMALRVPLSLGLGGLTILAGLLAR